ncbi:MAG: hypothetical protein ACYC3H_12355 [Bellilinea sp.]
MAETFEHMHQVVPDERPLELAEIGAHVKDAGMPGGATAPQVEQDAVFDIRFPLEQPIQRNVIHRLLEYLEPEQHLCVGSGRT